MTRMPQDEVQGMSLSIEIDIVNGEASRPRAEELFGAAALAEPDKPSWDHIKWASADLRVLIEADDGTLVCHAGVFFRSATWNGQKVHIGGVGAIVTRPDCRRRGYAGIALGAAVQTMRDHDAAQFALLFCEPRLFEFYQSRGWRPFTGDIYVEQAAARVRFEAMAPFVFDLKRRAPERGTLDLCGPPW